MPSSGMFRLVALVRTDVSEERSASIIRVTRIGELGTTSVLARGTRHNSPEDGILDKISCRTTSNFGGRGIHVCKVGSISLK
jgi:hypothetical protein